MYKTLFNKMGSALYTYLKKAQDTPDEIETINLISANSTNLSPGGRKNFIPYERLPGNDVKS